MKGNAKAILLLGGLFLLFVGLNLLFSAGPEQDEETEANGSRSSYKTTPYGTHAFYTLLKESDYPVTRFEQRYTELANNPDIGTLVIISPPASRNPDAEELKSLSEWVEEGKQLIVIDREIVLKLGDTNIRTAAEFKADAEGRAAARPLQPSVYTRGVNQVALTKYATRLDLKNGAFTYHVGDGAGAVALADVAVGDGRVVLLSEPYMVANNGIKEADNLVLALNLLAGLPEGQIAFDEYHHGHGRAQAGSLRGYFAGTPVPWMLAQLGLIAALLVYTYGRRFARPLPLRRERRTTNLEFVSSMANISRLARASDLAMQIIYSEFRKRLCRYCGLPTTTDTRRLATVAARRAGMREAELGTLLMRCEAVARGEPVKDAELLRLVERVREIESQLRL